LWGRLSACGGLDQGEAAVVSLSADKVCIRLSLVVKAALSGGGTFVVAISGQLRLPRF
jgi:hypothetical protein